MSRIAILQKRIRRSWRKMRPAKKRLLIFSVFFLLVGLILGSIMGKSSGRKAASKTAEIAIAETKKKMQTVQKDLDKANKELEDHGIREKEEIKKRKKKFKDGIPWNLTLVNPKHPMKEGYDPALEEIEGGLNVDKRIKEDLNAMIAAAKKDGVEIYVAGAYRSVKKQTQTFNAAVLNAASETGDYAKAYDKAITETYRPGESEHGLGLAVDLVDQSNPKMDDSQASTKASQWLQKHSFEYGFIQRYPSGKKSTIGNIPESWHYRYVGKEDAKKIHKAKLTLEEYLGEPY